MSLLCLTLPFGQLPAVVRRLFRHKGASGGRTAAVLCLALPALAACGSDKSATAMPTCSLVLPAQCPTPAPSYAGEVAAVFADRCVSCHGAQNPEAGIDLSTYAGVYAQRQPVLAQVYNCSMPQKGSPQLSAAQAAALLSWLVCEAPNN